MTIELWALFGCTIILLVSITIQALHLDKFAGYAYTLGNRDSGDLELITKRGFHLQLTWTHETAPIPSFSPSQPPMSISLRVA